MIKSIALFLTCTMTVILFQNCAYPPGFQTKNRPHEFETDPAFYPYIKEFQSYSNVDVSNIPVGFDGIDPQYAGMCYRDLIGGTYFPNYIKINREYWGMITEIQKTGLIFHELGHCALNREHVDTLSPYACPSSFMYPAVISTQCLQTHFQEYISELFP